jgi:hypothetical protein
MKIRFVDLKVGDRVLLPRKGGEQLMTEVVHMETVREGRYRIQFLNERYQYVSTEDMVEVLPELSPRAVKQAATRAAMASDPALQAARDRAEAAVLAQPAAAETKRFVVGQTYMGRFASDYDTKAHFTILSRTNHTVTTTVRGKQVRRGLSVYNGVEQFKPFGSYSMAMVIDANDPAS